MNPLQIKELKDHRDMLLSKIEESVEDGELYSVSLVIPNLKERIIENLRWGLFSRSVKDEDSLKNVTTKENFETIKVADYVPLLKVSSVELETLRCKLNSLELDYPIFSKEVSDKISGKEIGVEFEYESYDCNVFIKQSSQKMVDLESLLNVYELRLTIPDVELFFNLEKYQPWQEEYIAAYEKWKWNTDVKNYPESYIQIGGYGSWIQGIYTNNYIAQVNNGVGDAGSVFVLVGNETITAWVDMY